MKSLYASPLRVYLLLGVLSLIGIFCGLSLPISLFPNSSKPVIQAQIPYGDMTARQFLDSYGRNLEYSLGALNTKLVKTEKIEANYNKGQVSYTIDFPWDTPPNDAIKEVQNLVNQVTASMPEEVRRGTNVFTWSENTGFFAASFYSPKRDLDDLYKILDPIFSAELKKVQDASEAVMWNPANKEIQIEINPDALTEYQLLPVDITRAVMVAMESYRGGNVEVATKRLQVILRSAVMTIDDLSRVLITTPQGRTIHLTHVAKIDYTTPVDQTRVIRTSGALSVILFASPKSGGNIKKMSEDIIQIVESKRHLLPPDIEYRVIVDPSEFIRSSVNNVVHEVGIAAGLAVLVLFLFIGSFKNVVTAAIEIPMSIVLAFILMKLTDMNLNLISLGGLALSAGMNVDGSVVVMENIFRHFEKAKANISYKEKLDILLEAVNEVKLPIIASTIASIVVFAPLIFTRGLSSAILGDLAKAVVFSHGLSAIVALILVPTVRLQMMKSESHFHVTSPIEKYFVKLENFYASTLDLFLKKSNWRKGVYAGLVVLLLVLIQFVLPRLPKEIIGTPDTDWVIVGMNVQGNTLVRQMETQSEETEAKLLKYLEGQVLYTFTQVNSPNNCSIMLRLKDKKDVATIVKNIENEFPNSPTVNYWVNQWNPSELPLPDPENLLISVRGEDADKVVLATKEINDTLQEKQYYRSLWAKPETNNPEGISVQPRLELWPEIAKAGSRVSPSDLADYTRVATDGRTIAYLTMDNRLTGIVLKYPTGYVKSVEDLSALPLSVAGKLIPLKALANISIEKTRPSILRIDQEEQYLIRGRLKKEEKSKSKDILKKAQADVEEWQKKSAVAKAVSVNFENPEKEVDDAIHQLTWALAISTGLILLTMILQLGHVANSVLVFMSVPLGLIGVLLSLFIFRSTLSLNSLLGVILLNGIAVANSIILVDFLTRLVEKGMKPHEAALEAARTRLRPILMTSLTTTLGMLPIALGFGEGGRILQPLGIAVSGGLGVSMLLTLYVVPALQVSYLNWTAKRNQK
ncbi:MAG: efflux RND transporter permease subunit [Bdellovibrionales bacterium]|nr:efflux RND transporter permease subunit [Bdellovibrionales bacterium]